MLKTIFICAVACSSSIPAFAGERSVAPPGLRAIPHRTIPVRAIPVRPIPLRTLPAAESTSASANVHKVSTFDLPRRDRAAPAVYDLGAPAAARHLTATDYARPETTAVSPFALTEPRPQPAWRLTDKFPEVTARAGARYAVGDTLADHRRVGPPRSALDTMLVFRIDGSNDSPPLSVGGGVAGAMWKAGVTR
ncbi:hypothetical protein IAG41_05065 [Sphingomonas sp. JC676]|uniref:hypothetical protein n=1 Tax=Sphingomonas sp. JC676 TaxID=2768065 RepID=UPI00165777F6|nr:hypothetical protein [Sphingomonas sp. JC676]MBC9031755.1 hypothetical protein [Sphingomonas sp. JC676]